MQTSLLVLLSNFEKVVQHLIIFPVLVADTSEVEVAGIQGSTTYEDLGTAVMTTLPSNQTPRAQLPTGNLKLF